MEKEEKGSKMGMFIGGLIAIGVFLFIIVPMLSQSSTIEEKAEVFCKENGMEYYAFKPGFNYGATDGVWCQKIENNKVIKKLAVWVDEELYFEDKS